MKILLAGGGTLGSVRPLLAIWEEAKRQHKDWRFFWVGTKSGPEKEIVLLRRLDYEWLPTVKLRRYFAWQTFLEPFVLLFSLWRSLFIVAASRPDLIIGAGSFVSVPIIWAGWLARRKIIIHQQDARPSFANKLCAWCADVITVVLPKSTADFGKRKTILLGNPIAPAFQRADALAGRRFLGIPRPQKIILILGGSSGSAFLNDWVKRNLAELLPLGRVVHLAGREGAPAGEREGYVHFPFLDKEMPDVLAAADVVISRAGISTLSELAFLEKPVILAPLPNSHQEDNAFYLADQKAALAARQSNFDEQGLSMLKEILNDRGLSQSLGANLGSLFKRGAAEKFVKVIENFFR